MMPPRPWHAPLWERLRERRARGAMPHALLLTGPDGLGKRDFCARLVRSLLCENPQDGEACGRCRACLLLAAGSHPDRIDIGLELNKSGKQRKEIVVQQMRDLSARLAMASQFGGWQVASIDPADAMNPAAANALLKTLEEPTASSLLVLVADAPWRLVATIHSRCQRVDFRPPSQDQALAWLQAAGVEDAAQALRAAAGNPGLARRWFEHGQLAERQAVGADLQRLTRDAGAVPAVARRWQEGDALAQRLWFAAQLVAQELAARSGAGEGQLGSRLDAVGLGDWFARANRARESLRGPLRPELVVLELLSRWR